MLLTSGVVYGSSFSFMKLAVSEGAAPLGIVFWFAVLATFILTFELTVTGKLKNISFSLVPFCLPWGILSVVLPNLFFFYAAQRIPASIIAIGIALVPILTLGGAVLLRRESLTWQRAAGLMLGGIAVMMILLPRSSLPEARDTLFALIAFAGAACYAAEHLYVEMRAPKNIAVDQLLFVMFTVVTILLLPIVLATETFFWPNWPFGIAEGAMIAVTGITLLDYFLITLLILWAGPVFTSQAAYIVTLSGVAWGILIFQDDLSNWTWFAIGLLMLGLKLVRPNKYVGSEDAQAGIP